VEIMAAEAAPNRVKMNDGYEAEERVAIVSETTLAVRQSVGQAAMLAGLMATAGRRG
jgi:hypothetical protein